MDPLLLKQILLDCTVEYNNYIYNVPLNTVPTSENKALPHMKGVECIKRYPAALSTCQFFLHEAALALDAAECW